MSRSSKASRLWRENTSFPSLPLLFFLFTSLDKYVNGQWPDHLPDICPSIVKVIWEKDLAGDSPVPWYMPLDKNSFSISSFRLTAVGRFITKNMVGQRNLLSIPIISLFIVSSLSHWERKHFQVHHAFVLETILKYLFIFIGEGSRIYGTRSKGKPKGSGFSGKGSWRIGWRWQVNFQCVHFSLTHNEARKLDTIIRGHVSYHIAKCQILHLCSITDRTWTWFLLFS